MGGLVLGIKYPMDEQTLVMKKWSAYGLMFHFVDTIEDGICRMAEYEYI
ncbi:hypothetical protein [Anaerotruncus colihominis]|nr:hypothetical protein [Anaerotruncus colihominis]